MIRPLVIAASVLCVSSGCFLSRSSTLLVPSLPPSIPAVKGKPQTTFALRHIDVVIGTGAVLKPRTPIFFRRDRAA